MEGSEISTSDGLHCATCNGIVLKQKGNKQEIDRLLSEGWWIWRRRKSKYDGMVYVDLQPPREAI